MTNQLTRLRLAVAWLVVGTWLASLLGDAFVPAYQVPATVHGLMLIVAGYLFGPTITGKRKDDE
jgi:hypothetical protein